jgi:hypothetical protein
LSAHGDDFISPGPGFAAEQSRFIPLWEESVMLVKQASLAVVVAACAALFAAPVLAADAPTAAGSMGHMDHMSSMKAAPAKAPAKKATKAAHKHAVKKTAMKKRHKASCYDYAWQSADMKNCLAKHKKS